MPDRLKLLIRRRGCASSRREASLGRKPRWCWFARSRNTTAAFVPAGFRSRAPMMDYFPV